MDGTAIVMWTFLTWLAAMPFVFGGLAFWVSRHRDRATGAFVSAGGATGLDEFFYPSAYEARLLWDAELELPVPAPSPDRGPGIIEGGGRITIRL